MYPEMKAVILAGGFGTRLRPLTFTRPKPLLPLLNKPIIAHILEHLSRHGVTEAAITTNYLREKIHEFFGDEYAGVKLTCPVEEQPLGTAGSVKNIQDYFDDTFIVMQGDTVTDMDLTALLTQHRYYSGLATVGAVTVEDPWNYGVMELRDDGRIKQFYEKPMVDECIINLVNTGVYVMEPEALDHVPPATFYDFSKDLFPVLLERHSLFASVEDCFWVDTGRPGGYNTAKRWLMSKMESSIHDTASVGGRIEGPVVLGEGVELGARTHLLGPVMLGDNVKVEGDCVLGPYTVLGPHTEVRGYTLLSSAVLYEHNVVGSGNEIMNSVIAEGCRIGAGDRIQSDVLIGGGCLLHENVSVANGSRIWPNMVIDCNTMVNGTLRRFVPANEVRSEPRWTLRSLTPEEAFYFNKNEGNHVSYTGLRARSLWEFNNTLKQVELSSLDHHLRSDVNDFSVWLEKVICDVKLARDFENIKRGYDSMDKRAVRHRMIDSATERLEQLLREVRPKGYA